MKNLKEMPEGYVKIFRDPNGSGNDIIEFSDQFIADHGWKIDDTISFKFNKDNSVSVVNLSHQERESNS